MFLRVGLRLHHYKCTITVLSAGCKLLSFEEVLREFLSSLFFFKYTVHVSPIIHMNNTLLNKL